MRASLLKRAGTSDLDTILEKQDLQAFIAWVHEVGPYRYGLHQLMAQLLSTCAKEYEAFWFENALELAHEFPGPLPEALCPSVTSDSGVHAPFLFIMNLRPEEMLDEYFGLCYQTGRERERFEVGIKEALMLKLRRVTRWEDIATNKLDPSGGLDISGFHDWQQIWGDQIKDWWQNLSPEGLEEFKNVFNSDPDYIIEDIISNIGEPGVNRVN